MITKLKISNFKSHKDTALNLSNLTLLTGWNSSGKSSVIQSFLLLRQSYKKGRLKKGLDLNEPLTDLGFGLNALYRFASDEIISFTIEIDNKEQYIFEFDVKKKYQDTFLPIVKAVEGEEVYQTSIFNNSFQYVSASRWGGLESYPADTYAVEDEKQISLRNGQGELVAHFLQKFGEVILPHENKSMFHPQAENETLLAQVIAWENEISPRLTIIPEKNADKVNLRYGYKGIGDALPLKDLSGKNIGFGISYSLSVITALLSAERGALIIIENPEAHIHPKGQAKLAELIALSAQCSVQVIIETHSDHIINGILISSKSYERNKNGLDKNNVKLYFFGERNQEHASVCTEIEIQEGGKINYQPEGFFDQIEKDLSKILDF